MAADPPPPAPTESPESTEQRLYEERLAKAARWRELGLHPFGNGFSPSASIGEVVRVHGSQSPEELQADQERSHAVAGRLVRVADFGKAAFVTLQDHTGTIQAHLKKDVLGDAFAAVKQCDVGDFAGVQGTPFRSKTGELTLAARVFRPLTKALRPIPGKFAASADSAQWLKDNVGALSDVEQRYRQRYLDLLANPQVRETFRRRTRLVQFLRSFLDQRGFLEVETPMMHALVSGAAARPFVTHHNTLDLRLYLRIAPELHLKRLVVGGFDRVYEINRNFRNEGISTRHNPEFTMLEFYQAYATYQDLMDLTETMVSQAAQAVTGSADVVYQGQTLHFGSPWPRLSMAEALRQRVPALQEVDLSDAQALRPVAQAHAQSPAQAQAISTMNAGELMALLFEQHVEHTLVQPTFITHFPVETSPLARRNEQNPAVTDRFELFCMGREIANAFSELNDPLDQAARFQAQVDAKARGQDETMDYDHDYVRALEHGLPPTAGEGIGIDRLAMLFTDAPSIRDVILFPLLRPQS